LTSVPDCFRALHIEEVDARNAQFGTDGMCPAEVVSRPMPRRLVPLGDEDTAALCQVVDLMPAGDSTIVHLKLLPGLVEDYQALTARSMVS
jgi:hypothetical protein